MNEYKRLLVLAVAIDNLDVAKIPTDLIKDCINPLKKYAEHRIIELEGEMENESKRKD